MSLQAIPRVPLKEIPVYQASQWLKVPLLLSLKEMERFLAYLPEYIVPLSGLIKEGEETLSKEMFLDLYNHYLTLAPSKSAYSLHTQTLAMTSELFDLRQAQVEGGILQRIFRPVIQVQPFTLYFSKETKKFYEMTFSQESFNWGLLFTFPQLYSNPTTREVEKVTEENFLNAKFFKQIKIFAKENTMPTPFMIDEQKIIHPARVGKQFMDGKKWIYLPQKSSL